MDLLDFLVDVCGHVIQGVLELLFRGLGRVGVGRGLLKKQPGRPGSVLMLS